MFSKSGALVLSITALGATIAMAPANAAVANLPTCSKTITDNCATPKAHAAHKAHHVTKTTTHVTKKTTTEAMAAPKK